MTSSASGRIFLLWPIPLSAVLVTSGLLFSGLLPRYQVQVVNHGEFAEILRADLWTGEVCARPWASSESTRESYSELSPMKGWVCFNNSITRSSIDVADPTQ